MTRGIILSIFITLKLSKKGVTNSTQHPQQNAYNMCKKVVTTSKIVLSLSGQEFSNLLSISELFFYQIR